MPGQSPAILWVLLLAGLLGVWPAAGCKGEASLPAAGPAGSPTQSMATPGPTPTPTPSPSPTPTPTHQPAPTATPTLNQLAAGFRYSAVSAGYQTCLLRTDGVAVCWGGGSSLPRGRYSAISVGAYACGVREDGEARCWGDRRYNNHYGQMDAPDGKFQSVSVGVEHACGIRTDGRVECWGRNTDSLGNVLGQSDPPDGVFRSVSAGDQYTCGIRHDHAALCWGENYRGRSMPPDADFQSVSAGTFHACGLRTDGTAACWGANREGQATPPPGVFSAISAGEEHTCALRPDGAAVCWGWNGHGQANPPEGAFAAIAAGRWHTCALRPDGSPRCWGYDESGTATPPGLPVELVYTCASGAEGGLECRRDDPYEQSAYDPSAAPAGDFSAVSAAPYRVCALRSGGTVVCLKPDHPSRIPELALPGSGYVAVSAAAAYVCGLRADHKLLCDSARDTESAVLIPGSFRAVSVGEYYACAVATGGVARCWYHTGPVLKTHEHIPPTTPLSYGDFTEVSVGQWHACGVRSGGQVACWGDNYGYYEYCTSCDLTAARPCTPTCGLTGRTDYIGQAAAPGGRFRSVSAGYTHTCGIRADDGGVECWGESYAGRLTPPPGAYVDVSAGRWHTCGIRRGGRGVCWGHFGFPDYALPVAASDCLTPAEDDGPCHSRYYRTIQTQPLAGEFVAVAASGGFSCGARGDGALKCWGRVPGVIGVER